MRRLVLFLTMILAANASFAAASVKGGASQISVGSYIKPNSAARAAAVNQPVAAVPAVQELRELERRVENMEREIEAIKRMARDAAAGSAGPRLTADEVRMMIEDAINKAPAPRTEE